MSGDPFASLKAASRERAAALAAGPDDLEEPEFMATFKVTLPPLTVAERWMLSAFLDETAQRTVAHPDSPRTADWERALVGVLTDMAAAARDAKGKAVASAADAVSTGTAVTLAVKVPLNREARVKLYRVLKVAVRRAPEGTAGAAVAAIAAEFERFVYGPKGEQPDVEEERRRRALDERPGVWTSSEVFRG